MDQQTEKTEGQRLIAQLIEKCGGQLQVAKIFGCTQQFISLSLKRGWLPISRAKQAAEMLKVKPALLVNPKVIDMLDLNKVRGKK